MEDYFVMYDLHDNIVCYLDSILELKKFLPHYRLRDIKKRFINSNYINIIVDNSIYKIYKFN